MGSDDSGRGSIAFFGTYRPPVPLDIYSCPADPPPSSRKDELHLTDGVSYNQNGRAIPAPALKELLTFLGKKNPALAAECGATPDDAEKGRVAGLVFVSERDKGLETLHVALVRPKGEGGAVKVLSLGDVYGADTFGGSRMEDSGCIAGGFKVGARTVGHSLVYVSTKEPVTRRRTPWTVVYRTNLADGKTERLTPPGQYDVSPAVSPSGKMVAVANFRGNKWTGEIERLNTDIAVMNVDKTAQGGLRRRILIRDGGWPTWGSDNVIFFHRGTGESPTNWAVFRYDIATKETVRVTPEAIDAMTPAAISETRVAVAAIRQKSRQAAMTTPREEAQYRHIEIFDVASPDRPAVQISQKIRPKGDHYNPFVADGGSRIGYHRVRTDDLVIGIIFLRLPRASTRYTPLTQMWGCSGCRVCSQPFPRMAPSSPSSTTSSRPCGSPTPKACVLSTRSGAPTPSSPRRGTRTRTRTHCTSAWGRPSLPPSHWRSTPSPTCPGRPPAGRCSASPPGTSTTPSRRATRRGTSSCSGPRGTAARRSSTRTSTSWRMRRRGSSARAQ
ncbi:unnamed protein product [Triticum turgidum subsp. durum]|uniref:Uncharacterized protein n=1 Tax=Triticum turgidum subsp. durum TaxID=4567 RepID=A0A9R0Z1C2_TRITD|nr:unnamed protein product [Triticum turgidum subsp. durum]